MLETISHRGRAGREIIDREGATLGAVWPEVQTPISTSTPIVFKDCAADGRLASASLVNGKPFLTRDRFGLAPLYFGRTSTGVLCFASEVKALLTMTNDVNLLPPGHMSDGKSVERHVRLESQPALSEPAEAIAAALREKLRNAVRTCVQGEVMGSWLSGGLDSSAIVSLARPYVKELHTFSVGLGDAPDMEYARTMAAFASSKHHERTVTPSEMLSVLPQVIYHLESFDALLVRSSIVNYLVAKLASDYVPTVFSGEGGDELFAGYEYLKELSDSDRLASELADLTGRLHNTALQRVDRSAAAHGLVAFVPFLNSDVADYALRIPVGLKIRDGIEKWILRQALEGLLPTGILRRPKVKFWAGAGIGERLAEQADSQVSDADFAKMRVLPNGWLLNSKEELMYYRIFQTHFGQADCLDWMGRTKLQPPLSPDSGAPT